MNLSDHIEQMLAYKESLGYSRSTYESFLKDFQTYFENAGFTEFSETTVLPWCEKRVTETPAGFRRRLTPLRELSKYLYAMGYAEYIVPTAILPVVHKESPYIFTDQELINLFTECDKEPPWITSPCRHLIIPVIFRLIYFCGLRPNEGRELKRSDFCYKDKTLFIRKNKSHRERLIPMADDLAELCHDYLQKSILLVPDTEYLFPSPTGKPYTKRWLSDTFCRLWKASNPGKENIPVRVYLLRHRYATAVFMKWIETGVDINVCIPYLSEYMGHASFKDTAYYIHLLPERLLSSSNINWEKMNSLIPEVDNES